MAAGPSRIVVTGASGNVGTGVLRALAAQLPDTEVVGVCRRPPTHGEPYERVRWHAVDLAAPSAVADLGAALSGADVVIHLALAVQPVRDEHYLYRANVLGTQAVLEAMTAAGVTQLVYASSLGIYAPGSGTPVTEDWPTTGQATSVYSRHKVMVERILDEFELDHPEVTVSRFRPTVVVQREAAWLIKSLYLGPLVPRSALGLLRRRELPVLPLPARLKLQFVHADDVGDAVVRLIRQQVRGSFNIAADVLDTAALADLVGARPVEVPPQAVRALVAALSAARVVALTPGWYDVAFKTPLMDTSKARRILGWAPAWSSAASARELIEGLADGAVGTSEAMGWELRPRRDVRGGIDRVHDVSLVLWGLLAFVRALGARRARTADAAVVVTNLATGTPMALDRVLERRADPVALLAPVAVVAALGATVRGGWAAVAATGVLQWLRMAERNQRKKDVITQ
ncbi:NAD-dependent epimerase/dehydratase family protein [Mycolicibacterium litorale]|uniref:NAD-dependent epimerase/dehydratase family protein n=1 Tax=Mycolicibacterium litorale TaxID=758802 RepID=UPI003CF12D0D